jgi:predicted CXXCH cytochrome family protein
VTVAGAPLWAKQLRNTTTTPYTLYGGGKTLASTVIAQPGANSLTCLSCHDGTMALGVTYKNNIKNTAVNVDVAGTGFLAAIGTDGNGLAAGGYGAYNPVIAGASGNDLSNDHPIGMTYAGVGTAGLGTQAAAVALGFKFYGAGGNVMECASCHEPHTETAAFMRVTGATFCQGCHAAK